MSRRPKDRLSAVAGAAREEGCAMRQRIIQAVD